jgi:hypothetical protein
MQFSAVVSPGCGNKLTRTASPINTGYHQSGSRYSRRIRGWRVWDACGWGVPLYRCPACKSECRPLLDLLGVEPGRISGSLARDLAVLAAVVPYSLAARLAELLPGVKISAMGI